MERLISTNGLSFDDILVVPAKITTSFKDISLKTRLTRDVCLNAPIISSPLDTVTESKMAIAISRQGGIGFVHKNMSIEAQAIEVDRVKRSQHGVITDPFFLSPNNYIYEADELMAKYQISGVPICESGKLVGIVTNRDLRFETQKEKKVYEVMTSDNLITAPEGTDLEQAKKILAKHKIEKLPIIDENNRLKGLITTKDIEKAIKYPNASHDSNGRLLVGAAIDYRDKDMFQRCEKLIEAKVDVVSIESIYAYSDEFVEIIRAIKQRFAGLQVVAGNVVTAEAVKELILAGADAIKVGFGSENNSDININSGAGIPQFTAVLNCASEAKKYDVPVISDYNIRFSGDLTKAIVAGASTCMIGNFFSYCYESPNKIETSKTHKYRVYKSSADNAYEKMYSNGKLSDVSRYLLDGLRSGMYYCGAKSISDLQNAAFIKVTRNK